MLRGWVKVKKGTVEKVLFFLISMMLLFVVYQCAIALHKGGSSYVRFPDKIETFK